MFKLFEFIDPGDLQENIHSWLSVHTVGEFCQISRLKWYEKNLWGPINKYIDIVRRDKSPDKVDVIFFKDVLYKGEVYRTHTYVKKRNPICETHYYQHWSRDIEGILALKQCGNQHLIIGSAKEEDNAIDIFELLVFLLEHRYILASSSLRSLRRYEDEHEIAMRMTFSSILDVRVVDTDDLHEWQSKGISVDKGKWARQKIR